MSLELNIGPPQLAINEGNLVLVTERDGLISAPGERGLFFFDTRMVSSWSVVADGVPWVLLNSGNIAHYATRIFLLNKTVHSAEGTIPRHSLGLAVSRSLGGGMHEDLDLTNHAPGPVKFNLELTIGCDFADIFDVRARNIVRRGRITTQWSAAKAQLTTSYRNRDFSRQVIISVAHNDSVPVYANGSLSFQIALAPGESWHACLLY